jgi:hypothetical protein
MTSVPDGYKPAPGGPPPQCSSGAASILVDAAGAVAFAWLAHTAYEWSGICWAHETDCEKDPGYLLAFGIPAALYAGAVVRGTIVGDRCRDAKRAHAWLQTPPPPP